MGGEYWTVVYEGTVVRLKGSKGLRHLARLLAHPSREFHVTDLEATSGQGAAPGQGERAHSRELELRPDLGDAGELLDAQAKAACTARLDEHRVELDEAEGCSDPARAGSARQEMEFLVAELAWGRHLAATVRTGRYCAYTPDPRAPLTWER